MKTILCYGDSLTYGADPLGNGRHAFEDRWPTELGRVLGDDKVRIIAEGLGGRTTVFDDYSAAADRNGATILPTLLASHTPIDCVVIMLGTNDMKSYINGSALGAAMGIRRLIQIIETHQYDEGHPTPKVVVMAPPHCIKTEHLDLSPMFETGIEESTQLAVHYKRIADDAGVAFFDAQTVARAHPADGVHLDAENTKAIGAGVAPIVAGLLGL